MTTHQFNQMFMKPRTSILKTSYVNCLLQHPFTAERVGNAEWFISHSWNASISDTIDSVLDFFQSQPAPHRDAVVWFDVFCSSQHSAGGADKPSSWCGMMFSCCLCGNFVGRFMTTFRTAIANMGNLLLSIDNWKDPKPLERAWYLMRIVSVCACCL